MNIIECIEDLEDMIPPECVEDICTSGSNDEAVAWWLNHINFDMYPSDCIDILMPFGAWDRSLLLEKSNIELKEMVLWCAAWNVHDFNECEVSNG